MPSESADGMERSEDYKCHGCEAGLDTRLDDHFVLTEEPRPVPDTDEMEFEEWFRTNWVFCPDCAADAESYVLSETERPPELPVGLSVFTPQGTDTPVLRTPDGNYRMEPERARDLGRLLLARTEPETERRGSQ